MSEFGQVTENITLNTVDIDTHALEMQPLVDEDLLDATLQSLQNSPQCQNYLKLSQHIPVSAVRKKQPVISNVMNVEDFVMLYRLVQLSIETML